MCMPRATFGHATTCSGQRIGRNDDSSSAVSMLKMMPMQTAVKRGSLPRRVSLCVAAVCALMFAPMAMSQKPTESPVPPSRPAKPTPPGVTPPPTSPIGKPGDKSGDKLVRMNMTADATRITPGEKFLLAFAFTIEPHWYMYWENAGVSGAPTEVDVKAPPNFVVGRTLFPRPQIISSPEGATYGYEERAVLFVEITPPETAMPQVNFSAEASWMVCKDICKMGSAKATLSLPFGDTSLPGAAPIEIDPAVAVFKPRLPKNLTDVSGASVEFDGKLMTITLPAEGRASGEFFPNPSPGVEFGEAKMEVQGTSLRTIVPVTLEPGNALGQPMRLAGVIGLGRGGAEPCYAFDVPLADDGRPQRN